MRLGGRGNRLPYLGEQPFLVGAQGALEDQPVGGVVAAKYRTPQFEAGQETLGLDEQLMLAERLPAGETGTQALLALREADDQGRQVFRLRGIDQARRVVGVLRAQRLAAETIQDHYGTGDAGLAEFFQRLLRAVPGFPLIDGSEHCVIAGFGTGKFTVN